MDLSIRGVIPGVTHTFPTRVKTYAPQSDRGLAIKYARSDSSSSSTPSLSGGYDHPDMVFMAVNYSHCF